MPVARYIPPPSTPGAVTAAALAVALGVTEERATALLAAVTALVDRYASGAPTAVRNEAITRAAAWLSQAPAGGQRVEAEGEIRTTYTPAATGALRASGGDGPVVAVEVPTRGGHRMTLSPRRFRDTITRRRELPGERNEHGEFVKGAVVETDFRASVQPLALEDANFQGGSMTRERVKVYVPEAGALAAAFGDREADDVALEDGRVFVVEESRSWPGGHTRAILLRES